MVNKYLKTLRSLPLNWSSISSFHYNKERWFDNFILGNKQTSKELTFGSYVDKRIQEDPTFLPSMPRYERMQHHMENVPFGKLKLKGTPDGLNISTTPKVLADFKTGKVPWTITRAKDTGQLKMYLLLLYLTEGFKPEEFICKIHWMPTRESDDFKSIEFIDDIDNNIKTFEVKHTMVDILEFGKYIKDTYKEMEEYCRVIHR